MRRIRDKSNLVVAFAFLVIIAIFVSIFLKNLNSSSSIATTIDEDVPKPLAPAGTNEENKLEKEQAKRTFSKEDLTIDEDLIGDNNVSATAEKKEEKKQIVNKQENNIEKQVENKIENSVDIIVENKEEKNTTGTTINQVSSEEDNKDNSNVASQNNVGEKNSTNTENTSETSTNQNENQNQNTTKPAEDPVTTIPNNNTDSTVPETNMEN